LKQRNTVGRHRKVKKLERVGEKSGNGEGKTEKKEGINRGSTHIGGRKEYV